MTKNGNPVDQHTFDKLSRLYIIALSTIALSIIVSQILIRKHLNSQQSDSTVINIAGRQRMLSQRLTKDIVSLSNKQNSNQRVNLTNTIRETLLLWQSSHHAIKNGSKTLGLPGNNSLIIDSMFQELNDPFNSISKNANVIKDQLESNPALELSTIQNNIDQIKKHENIFLVMMDKIVNQYGSEADKKVNWLRNLELFLTALTLFILLGEFIFIFWPTAKTVKNTLSELLKAERKAKKMAFESDELSSSKEKSINELKALNRAMDETLLFARTTQNGEIVHMGKKFSYLFNYTSFNSTVNFPEVLSINKSEQSIIENIIIENRKTGWQGEIKATNQNNQPIWLEMTIIPFNSMDDRSELLIIASDITSKKAAQIEIQHLTKQRFEEKMDHQKIISSKIIENQEKEQNRIAKDVHDGIGQMLTGLKYNLESIDSTNVEKTAAKVEHLKELTTNIIKGVRTATFNLTPPELSDYGIVPALNKLTLELEKLTAKEIIFFNKTDFNQRLDSLTEINIYRIVQEAINNAIKYANSSHILVSLSHSKNILSIVIDDDGKGFDPSKIKNIKNGDGGMGMTFMKERINYINGRLFLSSELGNGTRITLNIPLTDTNKRNE